MKKMKKSFMSLILFLMNTNNIYATTTGKYVVSENGSGFGKIFLLIIGVGLVSLVLFVGYMMDKKENTRKKREKFIKKQKEDNWTEEYEEDEYDDEYHNDEDESDDEENDSDDTEDEESDDVEDYYDDTEEDDDSMFFTQEIKINTEYDKDEEDEIEEVKEFERNLTHEYEDDEELYEEEIIINDEKQDDKINLMNNTMVFNSNELKEEKNNNLVKGYDFDEDDRDEELLEIESAIKAANIKRYTRKKNIQEDLEPKENIQEDFISMKKVIVLKKLRDESDIISQTRRKMKQEKPKRGRPRKNKENQEIKIPGKRGRKPGSKNKPKEPAKRGRKPGSKNKTKETKRRGRPPKQQNKSKRGRPPKNKTTNE